MSSQNNAFVTVDLCEVNEKGEALRIDAHLYLTQAWQSQLEKLTADLHNGNLAILAGSAISCFFPSCVPTGKTITDQLKLEILNALQAEQQRISHLIHMAPFEVIMAQLYELNPEKAISVVIGLTRIHEQNGLHDQIGQLLGDAASSGAPLTVVTTNYDQGIHMATCKREWPAYKPKPEPIVFKKDLAQPCRDQAIFHIHGAVQAENSLVFEYNREFQLDTWKRRFLNQRLRNKTLLVLGFSGSDLDLVEALSSAGLKQVIWAQHRRGDCEDIKWRGAAEKLAHATKKPIIALVVNDQIGGVLEPWTFSVTLADPNPEKTSTIVKKRFETVLVPLKSADAPWLKLWARWTAVRAGCGDLASLSDKERNLLQKSQRLEIEAFGLFYQGQHADAARKAREAAVECVREKQPVGRYLYHSGNEIAFYNRGGFSVHAYRAVISTMIYSISLGKGKFVSSDKKAFIHRTRWQILFSLAWSWPLPTILVVAKPLQEVFRVMLKLLRRVNRWRDYDKFIIFDFAAARPGTEEHRRAEDRFAWLGQLARLINVYRVSVVRKLLTFRVRKSRAQLEELYRQVYLSAQWASEIKGPCRLGKCWLVYLEVVRLIEKQYPGKLAMFHNAANCVYLGLVNQAEQELEVPRSKTLTPFDLSANCNLLEAQREAWKSIRRGQISRLSIAVAHFLYGLGASGSGRTASLLRLLGIVLLETY